MYRSQSKQKCCLQRGHANRTPVILLPPASQKSERVKTRLAESLQSGRGNIVTSNFMKFSNLWWKRVEEEEFTSQR